MYVMGSFAGLTLDGGYDAATTILTGTAGSDVVSLQRIDFSKTDSYNAIESLAQVKTTKQGILYGADGSDVVIGGTATAQQFGWADNCRVLETLRWYRDHVMAARPDWQRDIGVYYRIAPPHCRRHPA